MYPKNVRNSVSLIHYFDTLSTVEHSEYADLKRELRQNLVKYPRHDPWNYVGPDYYDRRYAKEVYDHVFTPEEEKEYVTDNWCNWYNPYNDGRDCTGVWFTSYIYVFPMKAIGKTIVYHFQSCDV